MYDILDCTLRDGGYVNNWQFSKEFARELYLANVNSNTEYMEIGFRRKIDNDVNKYGEWYYTTEHLINDTFKNIYTNRCKLVIMSQLDGLDLSDFVSKKDSLVSMIRIVIHNSHLPANKTNETLNINDHQKLKNIIIGLNALGYDVSVNVCHIDKMSKKYLIQLIEFINTTPVKLFYIADTNGHLDINLTRFYIDIVKSNIRQDIKIGYHAHNNLNNATTKSLLSLEHGVSIVDGTAFGYGRGSGNANLELLLANKVHNKIDVNLNLLTILEFINKYIKNYKLQNNLGYGYNIIFLLSGLYSIHINYAIEIIENCDVMSLDKIWSIFKQLIDKNEHNYYNKKLIKEYI